MNPAGDREIVLLTGDGVGPEVMEAAEMVLAVVGETLPLAYTRAPIGGASIEEAGEPLTDGTLRRCRRADAVLLGAVGGPEWDDLPRQQRPETALLTLRRELSLFANLRPVRLRPQVAHAVPLREELCAEGADMLIVRELSGGLYYGRQGIEGTPPERRAFDTLEYGEREIERTVKKGFELARRRNGSLTSVDKANVLETSRLWRAVVERTRRQYPEIAVRHLYVDNCAMQLVLNPAQFDVLVTENTFGDILSDLGGALAGSIGMLPSASISPGDGPDLYEPVHGSAPQIAGKQVANPLGTILSVQMLLEMTLDRRDLAEALGEAVDEVLRAGYLPADVAPQGTDPTPTAEMGRRVASAFARRI